MDSKKYAKVIRHPEEAAVFEANATDLRSNDPDIEAGRADFGVALTGAERAVVYRIMLSILVRREGILTAATLPEELERVIRQAKQHREAQSAADATTEASPEEDQRDIVGMVLGEFLRLVRDGRDPTLASVMSKCGSLDQEEYLLGGFTLSELRWMPPSFVISYLGMLARAAERQANQAPDIEYFQD